MPTPIINYSGFPATPVFAGLPLQGYFFYWPSIVNLTGGNVATDLDAQAINEMPPSSAVLVVIPTRGASEWPRVTDASSPATDLVGGTIRPTNYEATLRPFVLKRKSGF